MVNQVPLPDDIDSFVLENIVQEDDLLEMNEEEEVELSKEDDIMDLHGEEFLLKVPLDVSYNILKKEKPVFQNFLLGFFNEKQKKDLRKMFADEGIILHKDTQKTDMLEKIEDKIKQEFILKVKKILQQDKEG